jgi:hypothetical protein
MLVISRDDSYLNSAAAAFFLSINLISVIFFGNWDTSLLLRWIIPLSNGHSSLN